MAFVKFSSAILLLLCVSSIYSAQIDSDVIVRVRDTDYSKVFSNQPGEASLEITKSVQLSSSLAERGVTCPRVKDGAYKPEGVSSCLVAEDQTKRGFGFSGKCMSFNTLFTGASSIDKVSIKAKECSGVERHNCKEIQLVENVDFMITDDEICINDQSNDVCLNSKLNKCIRYYRLTVANSQSNEKLSKAEGACASASTYLVVASEKAALKGLEGRCLSSYTCDFEPLDLECTFARCTFNPQNFPLYIRTSVMPPVLTRRGIDIEELLEDECYKIRVPSNQGSAALDINNPATCGVHDSSQYTLFVTAKICGTDHFYKQMINPEPAKDGEFCNSDAHCEASADCDKTVKPFVCKARKI